jgi:hypothetical protein
MDDPTVSVSELLASFKVKCELCGEIWYPPRMAHDCVDGFKVYHAAQKACLEHLPECEDGDLDGKVVTRHQSARAAYHEPVCGENKPQCTVFPSDVEWRLVTRERAWKLGRVPCSYCFSLDDTVEQQYDRLVEV